MQSRLRMVCSFKQSRSARSVVVNNALIVWFIVVQKIGFSFITEVKCTSAETNIFGGYHGKAGIRMTPRQSAPSCITLELPIDHFLHFHKSAAYQSTNTTGAQIPGSQLEVLPIFRTCSNDATGRFTTWSSHSGHFGILFLLGMCPCGSDRQ